MAQLTNFPALRSLCGYWNSPWWQPNSRMSTGNTEWTCYLWAP